MKLCKLIVSKVHGEALWKSDLIWLFIFNHQRKWFWSLEAVFRIPASINIISLVVWFNHISVLLLFSVKMLFIYATNVLWVLKKTLQSNVPDTNSGIMTNALSTALLYRQNPTTRIVLNVLFLSIVILGISWQQNMEILLQDWNISGELSLQSFLFLDGEKLKFFRGIIKQRGFLNTQSNCWANCALQILLATPLQPILNETTSTIGVLLKDIFKKC